MKKTALCYLGAALAMSSPIIALAGGPDHAQPVPFGHGYAGFNTGIDTTGINYQRLNRLTGNLESQYKDESLQGWSGGLYTGYEFNLSRRYFADFEGFYRWTGSTFNFSDSQSAANNYGYKKSMETGLSLLPGIHLNKASLYARIGWTMARFTRNASATARTNSGIEFNHHYSGMQTGLGYRTHLFNKFFLQADYIYSYYSKRESKDGGGDGTVFYRSFSNSYLVGLMYQFGHQTQQYAHQAALKLKGLYTGMQFISNMTRIETHADRPGAADENWDHLIRGVKLGLNVGYSYLCKKNFYLAAEASTQFITNQFEEIGNNYKLKDGMRYGLSLLPGYRLNDSNLVFARLGWELAKFKRTGTVAVASNLGPNFNKYLNGFRVGLGYETALTHRLSLNAEYDYTLYEKFANSQGTGRFNYTPQSSQFLIGLAYRFH